MEPFKTFLSAQTVEHLANQLDRVTTGFQREPFVADLTKRIEPLEMKDRARAMAEALRQVLPTDPEMRAEALLGMLHPMTEGMGDCDQSGLRGWAVWPLTMVVSSDGLADFDRSMGLLREMTMRFTSEFAVRAFLIRDQTRALAILTRWALDPNEHVRRLVSEGSRPRLPWGERLHSFVADPAPILPLLEALRDDPSEYVRRSVANNLNDIAKDHPAVVTDLAARWMQGASTERKKLVRHALRSLIKAGDPAALELLGMGPAQIDAGPLELTHDRIDLGQSLHLRCRITSTVERPQKLGVDVVIWFLKADGTLKPKVFKGGVIDLAAGQAHVFDKTIPLRDVTTRKHYSGEQRVALRINGQDTEQRAFHLSV